MEIGMEVVLEGEYASRALVWLLFYGQFYRIKTIPLVIVRWPQSHRNNPGIYEEEMTWMSESGQNTSNAKS